MATYADYWNARGRLCFWVAVQGGYRPGAVLALCASKLGFSPNALTVWSVLAALGGAACAGWFGPGTWSGALALGSCIFLAYWLDCADGMLARVQGATSNFGVIFDKVADMVVTLTILLGTGLAGLNSEPALLPGEYRVFVIVFSVLPKAGYSVLSWLKDAHLDVLDRTKQGATSSNRRRWIVRFVGNVFDDVPWRLGLTLSWGLGWYWEFTLLYSSGLWVLFIGYLVATKRALDREAGERALAKK